MFKKYFIISVHDCLNIQIFINNNDDKKLYSPSLIIKFNIVTSNGHAWYLVSKINMKNEDAYTNQQQFY